MDTPNDIFENLRCVVCFDLAKDAVECLSCGNVFCKFCVSNIKCPLCRNQSTYKESKFARKIIDSIPVKCDACNADSTKGELEAHSEICSRRIYKCNIEGCDFSGQKEEFEKHLNMNHLNEILDKFDQYQLHKSINHLSLFTGKLNSVGKLARRGANGKFYCGERSDVVCAGCDGKCGPNSGCQCTNCMKIDIEFYKLPPGFTLNHDGVFCELIRDKFYCGTRIGQSNFCTPDNLSCPPCNKLSNITVIKNYIKSLIENHKKKGK